MVDLLPDEAHEFVTKCRANQLSFIPLVSPTTTDDRMPYVASAADSFVYCVRSVTYSSHQLATPRPSRKQSKYSAYVA